MGVDDDIFDLDLSEVPTAAAQGVHGTGDGATWDTLEDTKGGLNDDGLDGLDQRNVMFGDTLIERKDDAPWPKGVSPHADDLVVDRVEALLAVGYGPVPNSLFDAPFYAWRVFTQRRIAQRRVAALSKDVAAAELAREQLLVELVEANRSEIQSNTRLQAVLATVQRLEGKTQEHASKLAKITEIHASDSAQIRAEEETARTAEAKVQGLLARTREALEKRNDLLSRTSAKFKRLQIEARALKEQDQRAVQAGKNPEHREKLVELKRRAVALKPQVEAAQAAVLEAQQRVETLQAKLEQSKSKRRAISRRRTHLDKGYGEEVGVRQQALTQDQRERLRALADAGRGLLAARGAVDLDAQHLESIRAADSAVLDAMVQLKTHVVGITAYDKSVFLRGVLAGSAGAVLAVLALVYLLG